MILRLRVVGGKIAVISYHICCGFGKGQCLCECQVLAKSELDRFIPNCSRGQAKGCSFEVNLERHLGEYN